MIKVHAAREAARTINQAKSLFLEINATMNGVLVTDAECVCDTLRRKQLLEFIWIAQRLSKQGRDIIRDFERRDMA